MALLRGSPLLTIHKGTRPEDADDMKERGEKKKIIALILNMYFYCVMFTRHISENRSEKRRNRETIE